MYLVNTRPDINFVVNSLSRFMVDPQRVHWIVGKNVLCYLRGSVEYRLLYECNDGVTLVGDVDWAGCAEDMKSTSGCSFGIGSGIISWFSKKKRLMALSSVEVEYLAACEALCLIQVDIGGHPPFPNGSK
jgi:hypothetical protein